MYDNNLVVVVSKEPWMSKIPLQGNDMAAIPKIWGDIGKNIGTSTFLKPSEQSPQYYLASFLSRSGIVETVTGTFFLFLSYVIVVQKSSCGN